MMCFAEINLKQQQQQQQQMLEVGKHVVVTLNKTTS